MKASRDDRAFANLAAVSGGSFRALGIPLVAGRTFSTHDRAVSILLLAIAALASYVPARRALDVDPMLALRTD